MQVVAPLTIFPARSVRTVDPGFPVGGRRRCRRRPHRRAWARSPTCVDRGPHHDRRHVRRLGHRPRLRRGPLARLRGRHVGVRVRRSVRPARPRRPGPAGVHEPGRPDRSAPSSRPRRSTIRPRPSSCGASTPSTSTTSAWVPGTSTPCPSTAPDLRVPCIRAPRHGEHRAHGAGGLRRRHRDGGRAPSTPDGRPTGELQEPAAMSLARTAFGTLLTRLGEPDAIERLGAVAARAGITTLTDLGTVRLGDEATVETWERLTADPAFPARVSLFHNPGFAGPSDPDEAVAFVQALGGAQHRPPAIRTREAGARRVDPGVHRPRRVPRVPRRPAQRSVAAGARAVPRATSRPCTGPGSSSTCTATATRPRACSSRRSSGSWSTIPVPTIATPCSTASSRRRRSTGDWLRWAPT